MPEAGHELLLLLGQEAVSSSSQQEAMNAVAPGDAEAEVSGEGVMHPATKIESTLSTSFPSTAGLFEAFVWELPPFVYVCVMMQN